jgi:ABC-2 type transport system permease protein
MNSFLAVFKRELKSYFTTPLAYVFLVIFLAVAGYLAFKEGFYIARQADLQAFFTNLPLLFVFLVPAVAMRLWAEERKIGSVELLFTLPVTIVQAVLGKFFAAWVFIGIALVLTFPVVDAVNYLGSPDLGLIAMGYLGSFLVAGGFLAIGCFFSALSKNQVIAFVLSLLACAVLLLIGMPSALNYLSSFLSLGRVDTAGGGVSSYFLPHAIVQAKGFAHSVLTVLAWITTLELLPLVGILSALTWLFSLVAPGSGNALGLVNALESLSFQVHFDAMQKGILAFKDVAYFMILIAGWIAACTVILDERKAS